MRILLNYVIALLALAGTGILGAIIERGIDRWTNDPDLILSFLGGMVLTGLAVVVWRHTNAE